MGHKPVRVEDRRKVDIDLSGPPLDGRPVLTTPAGKVPIACDRVELGYDLETGRLRWCTVWGDLNDERDIAQAQRRALGTGRGSWARVRRTRRIAIDYWGTNQPKYAPQWLLDLIEQYRPPSDNQRRAQFNELGDDMERVLALTENLVATGELIDARKLVRGASAQLDMLGRPS